MKLATLVCLLVVAGCAGTLPSATTSLSAAHSSGAPGANQNVRGGRPLQSGAFSLVHTFADHQDGAEPYTGLTPDAAGDFFGTTEESNQSGLGYGNVFEFEAFRIRMDLVADLHL